MGRRVALMIASMDGGGAEKVTLALANGLIARGFTVDLVLLTASGCLLNQLPPGVRIVPLDARRMRNAIWKLRSYLIRERPHALLASMWPLTIVAIIANLVSRTRTRMLVVDHTNLSRNFGHLRRRLQWTIRMFYPLADARIIVSEDAAADASALTGLSRSTWTVITNPIDFPDPKDVAAIETPWASSSCRVLNVARLDPMKNQVSLLHAFARLLEVRGDAHLVIVGTGSEGAKLVETAKHLGIGNSVTFAGFQDDPWPYYFAADLFVLASEFEGLSNVIIEALFAGLNVVSTNCPSGPREILDGGRFGTLVPTAAPGPLADAMIETLGRRKPVGELRRRALQLSGPQQIDRYVELLQGV